MGRYAQILGTTSKNQGAAKIPLGQQSFWPGATPWEDPRPDLTTDAALWQKVLYTAFHRPGPQAQDLFGALLAARCVGAALEQVDGALKISRGQAPESDWRMLIEKHFKPGRELMLAIFRDCCECVEQRSEASKNANQESELTRLQGTVIHDLSILPEGW